MKALTARALSALITYQVVEKSQSLSQLLDRQLERAPAQDRSLVQELCYGVIRLLPRLDYWARQLMDRPLKGKYRQGHYIILIGLYQLYYMRIPAHAAVGETVQASRELKLGNFSKLINGVLRSATRRQEELMASFEQQPTLHHCHPKWLVNAIKTAYPEKADSILRANNERAPMWLRVNQRHHSTSDYQAQLTDRTIEASSSDLASQALCLKHPVNVHMLPGFDNGDVSVQDVAAQMAAQLLDTQPNERVLDACAAPGGKTCHILERTEPLTLTAIDVDAQRLQRVSENLDRLQLDATLMAADASDLQSFNGQTFDRILLDAPCSATGVIRRHPDIKWLRRADDIQALAKLQSEILQTMWQILKPGGTLLYATCSILPEENSTQIAAFLQTHPDAQLQILHADETTEHPGWQFLPGEYGNDGFYYAKLYKSCDTQ